MKARCNIVEYPKGQKRQTIKLSVEVIVETDNPYAVIEGLTDAINYPDGGVIVRSIGESYPQYLTANSCGRRVRDALLEIGL